MWSYFLVQFLSSVCNIVFNEFGKLDSLLYSVSLPKTPGAQIGVRVAFGVPGAA